MKIVALAGGVGGAKLADGLAQCLSSSDLTVIVNTGDDFEHYGLYICPDLDTVCYTLADLANHETGWGRKGETWRVLEVLRSLGGPDWFGLGALDLATHLERTRQLKEGKALSEIVTAMCRQWNIGPRVLPMCDQPVRTIVHTRDGRSLGFQEYFVKEKCEPQVKSFDFDGMEQAEPVAGALEAIETADWVVICPSNPWVSIQPILKVPGMQTAIARKKVVAVSPIIGGKTIKGPAAKMFEEMGAVPSASTVARYYGELLTCFICDESDASELSDMPEGMVTRTLQTIMRTRDDRKKLAADILNECHDMERR